MTKGFDNFLNGWEKSFSRKLDESMTSGGTGAGAIAIAPTTGSNSTMLKRQPTDEAKGGPGLVEIIQDGVIDPTIDHIEDLASKNRITVEQAWEKFGDRILDKYLSDTPLSNPALVRPGIVKNIVKQIKTLNVTESTADPVDEVYRVVDERLRGMAKEYGYDMSTVLEAASGSIPKMVQRTCERIHGYRPNTHAIVEEVMSRLTNAYSDVTEGNEVGAGGRQATMKDKPASYLKGQKFVGG